MAQSASTDPALNAAGSGAVSGGPGHTYAGAGPIVTGSVMQLPYDAGLPPIQGSVIRPPDAGIAPGLIARPPDAGLPLGSVTMPPDGSVGYPSDAALVHAPGVVPRPPHYDDGGADD
jgi:hypothetical protein